MADSPVDQLTKLPLAGQLAARSMRHGPTRISASVAAIALVTAAFVGLKGMTNSLLGEVEVWAESAVVDKVWFRNLPNVSYEDLRGALGPETKVVGIEADGRELFGETLGVAPAGVVVPGAEALRQPVFLLA